MSNVNGATYLGRSSMARARYAGLSALMFMLGGTACASDQISTCTGVLGLSVVLSVRDSLSRASLDAISRVSIRDLKSPFDSLVGTPYQASFFAPERVTTFAVRVDAPGYRSKATEVVVPASPDKCGTNVTQRPIIELVPLAASMLRRTAGSP